MPKNQIAKKCTKIYCFILLIFFCRQILSSQLLEVTSINQAATIYCGNTQPNNGLKQLELLLKEGATKNSYVLEIGCGALVAGIPILSFLNENHYVGIEPNQWLVDASLQVQKNLNIANVKNPIFLYNENFDARSTNMSFDYILAHSVISHAPLWQLKLFLQRCHDVLKDGGKVIFSLRLTTPNQFDGLGTKIESTTAQWQYPGNTFFHPETIIAEGSKLFKKVEFNPAYTRIIMSSDKSAFHEWCILTK